ncbi:LytTR family DNA-binding domain-containing protein [Ferruginibacter sp. HRS2-29]|uniref:LytR/AlgR family response regulator transcription factor n=1 Tax=Ferruginibacter sp. HRS2-29 TaxID=2487334 RepID=UPI0020CEE111|nr:LytTR family DNA-binding domain-containing protein [Ferruginibacter sp. HRS2-29]MCP9749699.1 DNA-binding response regulator [Ferruginibacter sp. HRS2-29]
MMQCIAVDDEPLALQLLGNYVERTSGCRLVKTFTDAGKAKKYLETTPGIDLLFMDIQMPDMIGTDLYDSLAVKPLVIFTTAFSEHAVEGFALDAIDYLLKPFSYERFEKGMMKAIEYLKLQKGRAKNNTDAIFVRSDYKLVKILLEEIVFVESVDDYVRIHRASEKPVLTLMSMKSLLEKLPAKEFIRIHRKYIVSVRKISHISAKKIMAGVTELPIGERFAEEVKLLSK